MYVTYMNVLASHFKHLKKPIKLVPDPIVSFFYIKASLELRSLYGICLQQKQHKNKKLNFIPLV